MRSHLRRLLVTLVGAVLAAACGEVAEPVPDAREDQYENLQFFPEDMPRNELIQIMRSFSFDLGVRCQHCHAGGDGISLEGVVYPSDEKPAKEKARAMLRMVADLNQRVLPELPDRREPSVEIRCVTCHRGLPIPMTLATHLKEIIALDGVAAAVARYRELRETSALGGQYDFGEWSMNELARELGEAGDSASAIAILEMNAEFYPTSAAIDIALGELHAGRGEREQAAARFRAALEKNPQSQRAREGLERAGGDSE